MIIDCWVDGKMYTVFSYFFYLIEALHKALMLRNCVPLIHAAVRRESSSVGMHRSKSILFWNKIDIRALRIGWHLRLTQIWQKLRLCETSEVWWWRCILCASSEESNIVANLIWYQFSSAFQISISPDLSRPHQIGTSIMSNSILMIIWPFFSARVCTILFAQ